MKKLMWTLIAIIVIGGISFGGYKVYGMGYDSGERAGYKTGEGVGYKGGLEVGYIEGYQTGTDDGIVEGKKIGYTDGYDVGEQEGYTTGYSSGLATGTQTGYQDGYSKGETAGYEVGLTDGFGHGYTIKDPTWAQVLDFLAKDKTDEKTYDLPTYVCSHFSEDVCNNAEAAGIRCAIVELRYVSEQGHMIVAFNTIDRGLVYFEPQSDEQALPAIGKKYYTTIIPKAGYYYVPPAYDDTIEDMVVIW
jgi:hypothetical protein